MPRDVKIMAEALRRFQGDREGRLRQLERRTEEVYHKIPAVADVDRELRTTAARIVLAAFESEGNPEEALGQLERDNLSLQRRRAELLRRSGYPGDYLDDRPQCSRCEDTGFLPGGQPCRCLLAYYSQEQNRRLSKLLDLGNQSFDTFSFDWYSAERWPEYGRSPQENMEIIREICGNYAHTFSRRSGSLLFTGAPGLGKTFLSACIAREVSDRGASVVYDTAGHVFQQLEREKFGRENPYDEAPDQEVNRYFHCDLLILDDLGTEMASSFVESAFYRIVNDRLINGRKTILSTNLSLEELGRRYGQAALSRIRGEYQILRFFGEDIRILKRDA